MEGLWPAYSTTSARIGRTLRTPLGWHLDRKVLAFLATVGTGLDVDEYDMAPDEDIK
ncbi:MAG: hypothetical protein QOF44_5062 [Streptomyces sp.]|nr:hypothetical protein [Streptomyces sp.]